MEKTHMKKTAKNKNTATTVKVESVVAPSIEEVLSCKGYPKVNFKDNRLSDVEMILVGGAITTWERFDRFADSIAHLHKDGNISQYGRPFGTFEDLIIEMPKKGEGTTRIRNHLSPFRSLSLI